MDALTYLKEKIRMCDNTAACSECLLYSNNKDCQYFEAELPEQAISIVERWSNEHPPVVHHWKRKEK